MFRAEIEILGDYFDKCNLIEDNKSEIVFYATQGGAFSPETKVKCIISKSFQMISMVETGRCPIIDLKRSDITGDKLKKMLNDRANYNGVLGRGLNIKGFVTGMEEDSIIFNVSQIIIMPPKFR